MLTAITDPILASNKDFPIAFALISLPAPFRDLAGVPPGRHSCVSDRGLIAGPGGLQLVWLNDVLKGRFKGPWPLCFIPPLLSPSVFVSRMRPVTPWPCEAGLLP